MFELQTIGRSLLFIGGLIALTGGLLLVGGRFLPWLGRLPGDFQFQRGNVSCFFPLATSIILSIILTIIFNLIIRFMNR